MHLKVHDPNGAAGVNIDLIRIAATALREGRGGYPEQALAVVDVDEVGGPVSARSSDGPHPETIVEVEVHL